MKVMTFFLTRIIQKTSPLFLNLVQVIKPPIVPALILEMPVDMTQMAAQQQIMAATFMQQQRQHMEDAQRKKIAALRNIRPPVPDEFPGGEYEYH